MGIATMNIAASDTPTTILTLLEGTPFPPSSLTPRVVVYKASEAKITPGVRVISWPFSESVNILVSVRVTGTYVVPVIVPGNVKTVTAGYEEVGGVEAVKGSELVRDTVIEVVEVQVGVDALTEDVEWVKNVEVVVGAGTETGTGELEEEAGKLEEGAGKLVVVPVAIASEGLALNIEPTGTFCSSLISSTRKSLAPWKINRPCRLAVRRG